MVHCPLGRSTVLGVLLVLFSQTQQTRLTRQSYRVAACRPRSVSAIQLAPSGQHPFIMEPFIVFSSLSGHDITGRNRCVFPVTESKLGGVSCVLFSVFCRVSSYLAGQLTAISTCTTVCKTVQVVARTGRLKLGTTHYWVGTFGYLHKR
jgi:hypothetical protein